MLAEFDAYSWRGVVSRVPSRTPTVRGPNLTRWAFPYTPERKQWVETCDRLRDARRQKGCARSHRVAAVPQLRAPTELWADAVDTHLTNAGQNAGLDDLGNALKSLIDEMRREFIASRSPWVHGERLQPHRPQSGAATVFSARSHLGSRLEVKDQDHADPSAAAMVSNSGSSRPPFSFLRGMMREVSMQGETGPPALAVLLLCVSSSPSRS